MNRAARNPRSPLFAGLCCALAVLCVAGCRPLDLPSYYGQHKLPQTPASVNGTDILADMFRQAGHEVYFRRTLVTDELGEAETIVWFPDDFATPKAEACEWFENWLYEVPGRTLVYVGRDFDAAPLYFKAMRDRVGANQKKAYDVRDLDARLMARRPRDLKGEQLTCDWFSYESADLEELSKLAGPWATGVDGAKAGLQLRTKLVPNRRVRRLLASGDDLLASQFARDDWEGSRILLVANGSFLLNLPLVNHQNRKLASRLIEATGPGDVVFLESGPGGPPIDPPSTDNSLWTLLGAWPLNVTLLQLAVAGVIFCFARWPIFGRPRRPPEESTSDFARHVEAVGQLLSRTKDRRFALERASPAEDSTANVPARGGRSGTVVSNRKAKDRR
jgi:hypothetical protein